VEAEVEDKRITLKEAVKLIPDGASLGWGLGAEHAHRSRLHRAHAPPRGNAQAYKEYQFYVQVGTGTLGYALALAYYLAEGLWLATALELGSLRARWDGLAILLVAWTPPHLLRPHGIDLINFL